MITLISYCKQHVRYFFTIGTFSLSHPDRTVRINYSPILRWSPSSLVAISAGRLHVQVPFLGNPPPGLKLLQPSIPSQFPQSECQLQHRHLEAVQLVEHLLKEPWQFSDVVLLTMIKGWQSLTSGLLKDTCRSALNNSFFSVDCNLFFSLLMAEAPRSGHALLSGSERQTSASSSGHGQRCW